MTVAAVMMVRDEVDIIDATVAHLMNNVDVLYVADNRSVDGTRELLGDMAALHHGRIVVTDDQEVGYWQSAKTTALARRAHADGHAWVVPCDADELWLAYDGRPVREYLAGVPFDVQVVLADLLYHVPTGLDNPEESNPVRRIGWRQPEPAGLPKVACRLRSSLTIMPGNHDAVYKATSRVNRQRGLLIRHYTWRSEDQYVRKIRNGLEAYQATDLPSAIGEHWRMWEGHSDDDIRAHYREWFHQDDPAREGLVYDPMPA
jgi:hypothetical protein